MVGGLSTDVVASSLRDILDKLELDPSPYLDPSTTVKNRICTSLSGGEFMRLRIALALLGSPRLVLLDETLGMLDPFIRFRQRKH